MKNHLGRTPLHVAAQQGHSAVVLALLQAGAKHTATDDGGLTPLHTACCSGDAGTVSVLVKAGANRDAWDTLDRQPIDVIGCHRVSTWPAMPSTKCVVPRLGCMGLARQATDQSHWLSQREQHASHAKCHKICSKCPGPCWSLKLLQHFTPQTVQLRAGTCASCSAI